MKLNIAFNDEGLIKAFKLHYNSKFPIKSRLMLIFGVVILIVGLVFFLTGFPKNPEYLKHILVLTGFVYIGLYFYRKKQLFKRAAAQKTFQGRFTFELNNIGLTFGKDDKVSKCTWKQIEDIVQDEDNVLFYFGKDKFYILPILKLSGEKQTEIQEIITKYYGK